jgi:hypothetical protein
MICVTHFRERRVLTTDMNPIQKTYVVPFAFCAGCASVLPGTDVYTGVYFYNFEFAYLTPTAKDERWCIKGDMSQAERTDGWGTTQVTVQGHLAPNANYGNMGACTHVLTVTRVVSVGSMRGRE